MDLGWGTYVKGCRAWTGLDCQADSRVPSLLSREEFLLLSESFMEGKKAED